MTTTSHELGEGAERYLTLLLESGALKFGEFRTKSGRLSPFFINTGAFDTGARLGAVGEIYAAAVNARFGAAVENIYGPAYKGIPLAVVTSHALAGLRGKDVSFTFNRKEAKDHGEGGLLVGRVYRGGEKVVIVEDVITGGTSLHETMPLLIRQGVEVLGAFVGVDREERGTGEQAARREIETRWGIRVESLLTITDIVGRLYKREFLGKVWIDERMMGRIAAYRAEFGVKGP